MRVSMASTAEDRAAGGISGGGGYRDAESLFRTKPISEIRNAERATRKNIEDKKEELRQLVGTRYRDLIDSADSIVLMKSSCESISTNISSIHDYIRSLSSSPISMTPSLANSNTTRIGVYGLACRVKYLVDTPENIWGCLDEFMLLEAAARYVRAKHVHQRLVLHEVDQSRILSNFPLLQHQWQIVESFKAQISQRSRERLLDGGLGIGVYTDALAAVSVIDELDPKQVLGLFLDSRKNWILQRLSACAGDTSCSNVVHVFCEVSSVIQVTVGQVGELFLHVLNDMPLFYKLILSTPPASQLYGGVPNPEEEVGLWKSFRDKLEAVNVILDKEYIADICLRWLRDCSGEIVNNINGRHLIEAISTGLELGSAEKSIRETMDSKEVLKGSLEWLKSVFGSEIEQPWNRIRELVLEDGSDLWDEIFENAFVQRMKSIIDSRFEEMSKAVNIADSVHAVGEITNEKIDFQVYLNRPSTGGGIWFIEPNAKKTDLIMGHKAWPEENDFQSCLNAYFGQEVSQIRDAVDSRCKSVLEDLLNFFESPKAALRLKDLAPYVQSKCHDSISNILVEVNKKLETLFAAIKNEGKEDHSIPPAIIVERALFIGRLMFALQNHSKHILMILGAPRSWSKEIMASVSDKFPSSLRQTRVVSDSVVTSDSPSRQHAGSRRQTSLAAAALLGASESTSPKLEDLNKTMRDLCIKAHTLWIQWLSDELSVIISRDLGRDDCLSATTPLRGWEETIVKQEESDETQTEMKISLPSMPSLYVISFLCRAAEEIHRIGGHVLDQSILQKFASGLLEKIAAIYENFVSTRETNGPQISEKGILQILLDLRFVADVLSGGESAINEPQKSPITKSPFRRKPDQRQTKLVIRGRVDDLITRLAQTLDPIDWLTYEPFLWENEKQSYLRHAVFFGFFVQLNRLYTDTVQKLPTNAESNIMRCSTVPRFKYLPVSAPALSSRGTNKGSDTGSSRDDLSRNPWKAYPNGDLSQKSDLDDSSSLGVASPFLKSFMQVGSRFGESTLKLGSMLTDGQVGIFKDRSAAAMSTFGDILPTHAAGLLSSFTQTRSES